MARLLVIEDEPDIALALQVLLTRHGHDVSRAADGQSGLRVAHQVHPELVVLDVGLPMLDGWAVLERIRALSDVPVLLLTAQGRDEDKVRGLRAGADDYLTKPFHNAELVARVEALLRRAGTSTWTGSDLVHGDVVLSPARRTVSVAGRRVDVTALEFRLLATFLRAPGEVLTATQLLHLVWEDSSGTGTERVRLAVLRLRRKLGWQDAETSPLRAVRGAGYRLEPAG